MLLPHKFGCICDDCAGEYARVLAHHALSNQEFDQELEVLLQLHCKDAETLQLMHTSLVFQVVNRLHEFATEMSDIIDSYNWSTPPKRNYWEEIQEIR